MKDTPGYGRAVVHEMRNQLAVAVANLESWLDGKLDPTPLRIKAVLQALSTLDALIDDLYDAAREPSGKADPQMPSSARSIDVCSTITNEVMSLEAAAAEKGVRLEVAHCREAHDECLSFYADPVRVGQIVKNVVLNAIRYTPAGSSVLVDCHRGPGQLELLIADEGPGVSDEDTAHIFEAGYRGSAARSSSIPGNGFGLSIAKRLVEDHGGRIELVRRERGAAFLIELPGRPTLECARCKSAAACSEHPLAPPG